MPVPKPNIPITRYQAWGLLRCLQRASKAAYGLVREDFGGIYRGGLQGTLRIRLLIKELIAEASEFTWEVRVRDYYGNAADPDSLLPVFALVCFNNGAGVVFTNSTHRRVPRSVLQRTGLTNWSNTSQEALFDPSGGDNSLGWGIPSDLSDIYFLRFLVDRSRLERDVVYGFDLIELEAGGHDIRRFVVRDLAAYADDQVELPEPAPTQKAGPDLDDLSVGPFEDVAEEEPEVTWKGDETDSDELN